MKTGKKAFNELKKAEFPISITRIDARLPLWELMEIWDLNKKEARKYRKLCRRWLRRPHSE